MPLLEFNNVGFGYKTGGRIVDNISFSVEKGELVAIIGASGCGKSTLFRLITRLEANYDGSIEVNGEPIEKSGAIAAFMPQKDLLLPWRNILKNVALPLETLKMPKQERISRAKNALSRVGLSGCEEKKPSELSGGMRQRASFARTLMTAELGRELLLLDEPFSALDSITRTQMQDWLLKQVRSLDKTVMLITHDIDEALLLAGRVIVLCDKPASIARQADSSMIKSREHLFTPQAIQLKEELTQLLSADAVLREADTEVTENER